MDGQSQPSKRSLGKNHCFPYFGANQNLGQFRIVIKNVIPSCNSTLVLKKLKTLGSKNFSLTFSLVLHRATQASYHVEQSTVILVTQSQRQETLIARMGPIQMVWELQPMYVKFWSHCSQRILGVGQQNWSSLMLKG